MMTDNECQALVAELMTKIRNGDRTPWWEIQEIKDVLAKEFGRRNGWRLSSTQFSLRQVARGSSRPKMGEGCYDGADHQAVDHAYFYRWPDKPYRPAAFVAHLYDYDAPSVQANIQAACRMNGVAARKVSDFPSWWFPGFTTLVVYTPDPR